MKNKSIIIAIALIVVVFLALVTVKWFVVSEPVIKTAVKKGDLADAHILCTPERATGFDWRIASTNDWGEKDRLCVISGPNPFDDLNLKYDFIVAGNTYIFYVESVREYFSEEMGEQVVEYTVSGWDILYPVRHEAVFGILKSPNYILQSDLNK